MLQPKQNILYNIILVWIESLLPDFQIIILIHNNGKGNVEKKKDMS